MANRNGLISSKDVSATGAVNSNFFLRKGQAIAAPTLVSPVSVVSADGSQTGTITETNIGQMVLQSGVGDMTLYAGTGSVYMLSPDTNSSVQLSMANTGPFTIAPTGDTVVVGDNTASGGAALQINGASGVGRVYDTVYNKPASSVVTANVFTSPAVPVATNALIGTGTLSAGLYMLQARVSIGTGSEVGKHINCYVEDLPPTPTTYFPYSSITITPGCLSSPVAPDDEIDATFSSAVFTIPEGLSHLNYFVEVAGAWNFGNGGELQLQIVKLA